MKNNFLSILIKKNRYNHGAMENAGVVTFNDAYVWKEEVDSSKNTWLADVVTHELCKIKKKYLFNLFL